jgi:hypothetical protein
MLRSIISQELVPCRTSTHSINEFHPRHNRAIALFKRVVEGALLVVVC